MEKIYIVLRWEFTKEKQESEKQENTPLTKEGTKNKEKKERKHALDQESKN